MSNYNLLFSAWRHVSVAHAAIFRTTYKASYRTANLQMLHFIYLFNKYTY